MSDRLLATITLHRHLYRDDPASITRMVVRTPPATRNGDGEVETEPAAAVGMSMAPKLTRYLGHPENYGDAFPWRSALWALRSECRRRHRYHRGPEWGDSLCHAAVRAVVVMQMSVRDVNRLLGHDDLAPVIRDGLAYMEEWMSARKTADLREATDVQTSPPHRPLPGLHAAECPSCRKVLDQPAMMRQTRVP